MKKTNFPLKTSKGSLLDNNEMVNYISKLSIQELITELDYSRASKNYDLEIIVMNEYYRKQAIKDLK
ncbi:hypothetical protein OGZ37_04410 [Lactococcus lactis]|uniref:hypothetical protein n=1 Tax=Lactococcus lactis TaxID=1358 RepID=UPI00241885EF|nr:hypothetical protein [Lactococcus lactis]MDG4965822.1 hypothetical protein [Lactococcus lactis]